MRGVHPRRTRTHAELHVTPTHSTLRERTGAGAATARAAGIEEWRWRWRLTLVNPAPLRVEGATPVRVVDMIFRKLRVRSLFVVVGSGGAGLPGRSGSGSKGRGDGVRLVGEIERATLMLHGYLGLAKLVKEEELIASLMLAGEAGEGEGVPSSHGTPYERGEEAV